MKDISKKECVFKYDTKGNLFEYIEYDGQKIKNAYNFEKNVLKKIYHNHSDDDEVYNEVKSVALFPEGGVLKHDFFENSSRVIVRNIDGGYMAPKKKIELSDGNFTSYSIKPELLEKWIR